MDDNSGILWWLEQMLQIMGHSVVAVEEGSKVLENFISDPNFDVMLLDVENNLGMGGIETLEKLLKISPEIKTKVIFMSGNYEALDQIKEDFKAPILKKPFVREKLVHLLS